MVESLPANAGDTGSSPGLVWEDPTWLAVSSFMVIGLVSGLSLANHSDSGSFLVVHASLSQDGLQ